MSSAPYSPPLRPALSCVELTSVARGIRTVDEMCKKAPIRVLESTTVCPGKYVIVVGGEVGDVEESHAKGLEIGGPAVVDSLLLPNAHDQLIPAIEAVTHIDGVKSVGVVETFTVASAILSADAACKRAGVQLVELRLARGLGGKAFYTFTGSLDEVEASMAAAVEALEQGPGMLLQTEIIPRPHQEMVRWIV
jgi:microcompartment protein CcmL/EutN